MHKVKKHRDFPRSSLSRERKVSAQAGVGMVSAGWGPWAPLPGWALGGRERANPWSRKPRAFPCRRCFRRREPSGAEHFEIGIEACEKPLLTREQTHLEVWVWDVGDMQREALPAWHLRRAGGSVFLRSVAGDGKETGQMPRWEDAGKASPRWAWRAC